MKTHSKYSLLACCAFALAAIPAAFAHDDDTDRFMKMDTDGDGYVSRAEANVAGEAKFARADTNHDGMVTVAELEAEKVASGEMKHHKLGTHDKMVSDWVAKADTNGDGQLTLAEASASGNAMFDQIDANGDGKISKEECKAFHQAKKQERNDPNNPSANN